MSLRAREALRRLGRDWDHPADRVFAEEWFLGRIPSCGRCDAVVVMHIDIGEPVPEVYCDRCDDWFTIEAKNEQADMVLVEEEYGFRYWAWYPMMSDAELESFWHSLPRIHYGADLDDFLPGEWDLLTHAGFYGAIEDFGIYYPFDMRRAHIHEDKDSWLELPTKRHAQHASWRVYERQVVRHRGAPNRLRRRNN